MALDGLTVQSASPRLGRNIRAIGAQGEWTYCAIDDEVWCFLRARFVGLAAGAPAAVDRFELCANQPGTRQFFPKSFLGDDAAVLAWSIGEEPASPRRRAGVASMAFRTRRKILISTQVSGPKKKRSARRPKRPWLRGPNRRRTQLNATPRPSARPPCGVPSAIPAYRAK